MLQGKGWQSGRCTGWAGSSSSQACPGPACRRYLRAYLHYLFRLKEAAAWRLLSLHNLHFYAGLMKRIREAIGEGRLGEVRGEVERGRGG